MDQWYCHLITILTHVLMPTTKAVFTEEITVSTSYGQVKGISYPSQYASFPDRWINSFRGIPYAKRLSQYGDEWREKFRFHNVDDEPYWSGTWDATKYKPACPQMPWLVKETVRDFSEMSEDCLYLDIYTPRRKNERQTNNPYLYPVLVFLHGGGFIMGSSRQWPGLFLAERNIVVVVVNYRLNVFGFLSTGDKFAPGNYGMFDQVRALKFIKKIIRSFRGNPQLITLMGQDAGAASVGMHMVSPRSAGLFQKAIMLSGSEMSEWAVMTREDSIHYAKLLSDKIGCSTADSQQMVDCLKKSRGFEDIVQASAQIPMKPGRIGNPWAPVVDGPLGVGVDYAFLPEHPAELQAQGRRMKIPLLAGMVRDEGAYYIPNLPNLIDGIEVTQFKNIINEFIQYRDIDQPSTLQDALEFQYTYWPQRTNTSFIRKMLMDMMGDYMFGAAISETIRSHVRFSSVYFYAFEYSSWKNYIPHWRGISHGQDLDYIFGLPFVNVTYMDFLEVYPRQLYEYPERNISEYMINMITNFTAHGEPTPRFVDVRDFRNVTWFHYNLENHTYLCIRNHSENKSGYRLKEAKFWNNYFPKVAGYNVYYRREKVQEDPDKADMFEILTWSLTALCGVLLITVIFLIIVLTRRSRTKNYPRYQAGHSDSRQSNHHLFPLA